MNSKQDSETAASLSASTTDETTQLTRMAEHLVALLRSIEAAKQAKRAGTENPVKLLRATAGRPFILGIDGPAGSGKTELARRIRERISADLIQMDDFFPRTAEEAEQNRRLHGAHLDYLRFLRDVATPLRQGGALRYAIYNCAIGDFHGEVKIAADTPLIIEGVYSCHPDYPIPYDLRVFLTTSPHEQLRRLRRRERPALLQRFQEEWLPYERAYFERFGIPGRADLIVEN